MKKLLHRKFGTVPITEVLQKAIEVNGKKIVEKEMTKEEPYFLRAHTVPRAFGRNKPRRQP